MTGPAFWIAFTALLLVMLGTTWLTRRVYWGWTLRLLGDGLFLVWLLMIDAPGAIFGALLQLSIVMADANGVLEARR